MTRHWVVILALLGALAAAGCKDVAVPVETNRLEGIMVGSSTRSGVQRPVIAIASKGRFMAVEYAPDGSASTNSFFYDGTYTITNGSVSASSVRIYAGDVGKPFLRRYTETATVTGTATIEEWQLSIAGAPTTTFDLSHDPLDRDNSSLARLAGTWEYDDGTDLSTLSIDTVGNSGTVNSSGCNSDGDVAMIDARYNVYDVATVLFDNGSFACPDPVEGAYSGFVVYSDNSSPTPDQLLVVASKKSTPASTTNDYLAAYVYERQPSP